MGSIDCLNKKNGCKFTGTKYQIVEHFKKECQFMNCRYEGCGWIGKVSERDSHEKNECEFSLLECKYVTMGCCVKCIRKELKAHENDCFYKAFETMYNNLSKRVSELEQEQNLTNITLQQNEEQLKKLNTELDIVNVDLKDSVENIKKMEKELNNHNNKDNNKNSLGNSSSKSFSIFKNNNNNNNNN
eukprot:TRINITY_DN1538_c0_g2_i1.p1 TRINITY_DN1538_c0_g2~~TRINITY_DN1538_c0_g2_i1.p1  ORF type:complete len:204 (-),score=61.75 TRINITY_DN1538_c0_g2_i1:1-561(-)